MRKEQRYQAVRSVGRSSQFLSKKGQPASGKHWGDTKVVKKNFESHRWEAGEIGI